MPPRATVDFESRSECSLKNCGAWKYSLDSSTEILCLGFRLPTWAPGRTALWYPEFTGIDIPPFADYDDLLELIEWIEAGELVEAHNSFFEKAMWQNILVPRYGFPAIASGQWRCSQAKAAAYALPRKLGEVAEVLQLTHQKTQGGMVVDDGTKTKQKTYKPRKPRKKEREAWAATHGEVPHPVVYWDTPDVLMNLFAYCRQDVLAEEELSASLDDLSPDETEIYLLDQTINQRGFQLDLVAVKTALTLIGRETTRLNKELEILTSGKVKKATQRAQMVAWFKTQGLDLPDTQKATIDDLLESPRTLSPTATRGLQLVRTLGRSSTAKYRKMLDWAAPDGRVRGGLLYHGASTGRFSGTGVQPHNFPKGKPEGPGKDQEALWSNLIAGKTSTYPDIMEALSEGLRGAITASKGKQLYVADFASIEARVLLWLADDQEALDVFRRGEDIYLAMASEIYGRVITKGDKEERALGKVAVLGCLAGDTLVLTLRGWVPLFSITKLDRVWDGTAWVWHEGLLDQGFQETICLDNLILTPDHLILAGNQWVQAAEAVFNDSTRSLALESGKVNLALLGTFEAREEALLSLWPRVRVILNVCCAFLNRVFTEVNLPVVTSALLQKLLQLGKSTIGDMRIFFLMFLPVLDYSTVLALSLPDVKTPMHKAMPITGEEEYGYGWNGWKGTGRNAGEASLPDDENSWPIFLPLKGGITRCWNWIAKTITKDTNREICGLLQEPLTQEIKDKWERCSNASKTLRHVYDLANAGPRHRFTVLTTAGPVIVHNCGYQMGATKFANTALVMGGITLLEDLTCTKCGKPSRQHWKQKHYFQCDNPDDMTAVKVVDAYREKFWKVKQLWEDMNAAAIAAVLAPGSIEVVNSITWQVEGDFLFCYLPSGRRLSYPFPEIHKKATPWGELRNSLTFEGVNPLNHQWQRQTTYGGSLVENVVQAIARDLMARAMLRCEQSGTYQPVLSVHDELIAESAGGDVKEFEALMAECPLWATNCPIAAEGYRAHRYRK